MSEGGNLSLSEARKFAAFLKPTTEASFLSPFSWVASIHHQLLRLFSTIAYLTSPLMIASKLSPFTTQKTFHISNGAGKKISEIWKSEFCRYSKSPEVGQTRFLTNSLKGAQWLCVFAFLWRSPWFEVDLSEVWGRPYSWVCLVFKVHLFTHKGHWLWRSW